MSRLQNRVALIIGGARGVGRGIARKFASEGARVLVLADADDYPNATSDGLESVQADCCDKAALAHAIDSVISRHGRVDILVNALGGETNDVPLAEQGDEEWSSSRAAVVDATRWAMQAVFAQMRKQGEGQILNIASIYGESVWRAIGAYQAASEAIKALTRTAAEEWGPHGIRVNAIIPSADDELYAMRGGDADEAQRLVQGTPLGRMGDPEADIGGAAMFLVTESGRYLTGHILHADGGQHLSPSPYEALIGPV